MEMFNLYLTFLLGVVVFQVAVVGANDTKCLDGLSMSPDLSKALRGRITCVKQAGKYRLVSIISSFFCSLWLSCK